MVLRVLSTGTGSFKPEPLDVTVAYLVRGGPVQSQHGLVFTIRRLPTRYFIALSKPISIIFNSTYSLPTTL